MPKAVQPRKKNLKNNLLATKKKQLPHILIWRALSDEKDNPSKGADSQTTEQKLPSITVYKAEES